VIQVRYTDLSPLNESGYQRLYKLASPGRQQRADRYLRKEDARRCIVADALLRYALRHTLGTDRAEPALTEDGKPFLPGRKDFHFNLSHSGNWVVIAWSDRPMGIDVEVIAMDEGKEQLARRFFSADEQDYLFATQGQERALRFFEIWTKKESYLKYLGTGINRPLHSFSVLGPLEVAFSTRLLEDAVWTLCAENSECKILPVTVQTLLSE
jgi:4'-phosphopantetheinyl transferase